MYLLSVNFIFLRGCRGIGTFGAYHLWYRPDHSTRSAVSQLLVAKSSWSVCGQLMDVELSDATTSITLASITIGWLPYAWKDEPFTRHHVTTYWCPDAEEHYFRILVFKCTTNPRDVTAHRWLAVVVLGHMWQPTEDGFITKTGGGVMRVHIGRLTWTI